MMYKLLIVDDEKLVREELKILLDEEKLPVRMAGEAKNGQEALNLILDLLPDIVITDVRMPVMDGIELIKTCQKMDIAAKFIIISGYAEFEYVKEALESGVLDYVLKPAKSSDLSNAVKKAIMSINRQRQIDMDLKEKVELEKEKMVQRLDHCLNELIFSEKPDPACSEFVVNRIPEIKNAVYAVSVFCMHRTGTSHTASYNDNLDRKRFYANQIMREFSQGKRIIFNNMPEKTEILALCYGNFEKEVELSSIDFAKRCFSMMREYFNISITAGISSCGRELQRLGEYYMEAKQSSFRRFTGHRDGVFYYIDAAKNKQDFKLPGHKLQTLEVCMQHLKQGSSLESVRKIVRDIFSEESLAGAAMASIQMLFTQILAGIFHFYESRSIQSVEFIKKNMVSTDILNTFSSNTDIEEFIIGLIKKIVDMDAAEVQDAKSMVCEIKKFIDTHFHEDIGLITVADHYHLNFKYLSKVFKNMTGLPFCEYLTMVRMDRAKMLLEETKLEITEIADSVGYSNQEYFYKVFKKTTGKTPGEYRAFHMNSSKTDI